MHACPEANASSPQSSKLGLQSFVRAGRTEHFTPAMAPLRLIHVGVGGRGTWPVALIAAGQAGGSPQFESAALVDINPAALAAAREVSGLGENACFSSLSAALGAVESDAVMIVTSRAAWLRHSLMERTLWPTSRPMSQSKVRKL